MFDDDAAGWGASSLLSASCHSLRPPQPWRGHVRLQAFNTYRLSRDAVARGAMPPEEEATHPSGLVLPLLWPQSALLAPQSALLAPQSALLAPQSALVLLSPPCSRHSLPWAAVGDPRSRSARAPWRTPRAARVGWAEPSTLEPLHRALAPHES